MGRVHRWGTLLLVLGCGGDAREGAERPCSVVSSSRVPDAMQPSPSSAGCDDAVFGTAALAALDAFAAELDERWCEVAVRCGVFGDAASCLQAGPALPLDRVRTGVEAGRTGVVAGAAAALADWLVPAEGCVLPSSAQVLESALQLAFPGRGRPGDACWVTTDCAGPARCDGSACDGSDACCSGVCVEYRRGVPEGGRCDVDECGPGLSCYRLVGTKPEASEEFYTCHPALSVGSECSGAFGESCEEGTICRLDAAGVSRCLVTSPELGESCAVGGGTIGCSGLDVACGDQGVCGQRQPLGASCRGDADCVQRAACVEGRCLARLGLGVACQSPPDRCGYGLSCGPQSGVCERPPARPVCGGPG